MNNEFIDRMMSDIQTREKHLEDLRKAERDYFKMHQKSIDEFEKDLCHRRLYTDACLRSYRKIDLMQKKEKEDMSYLKHHSGTASKSRIDQFLKRVNNGIKQSEKSLEQKRKIRDLNKEAEYEMIKSRR